MRIGSIGAIIPAVLGASLLAACGASAGHPLSSSSSKAPDTTAAYILPRMETAVHAATSVHMAGTAPAGSQQVSFDLSFYGKTGLSGTITEGGATFTVLTANGKTYIRADKAFLKLAKLPTVACATICGKYIELPGAEASQITGSLSLPSLVSQAFSKLPVSTSLDTSEVFVPATDNGQAVLRFSGGGDTIEVAGNGTPFPVLIAASGTSITFSQWNAVTPPPAPPARKVLNLSHL